MSLKIPEVKELYNELKLHIKKLLSVIFYTGYKVEYINYEISHNSQIIKVTNILLHKEPEVEQERGRLSIFFFTFSGPILLANFNISA